MMTGRRNNRVPGVACSQDAKLMDAFTERLRVLLVRGLGPATRNHLAEWRAVRVCANTCRQNPASTSRLTKSCPGYYCYWCIQMWRSVPGHSSELCT